MAAERKLDELAADYVVGNLSAAEADEFARLMVENPELRSEVDRLEKTVGLMLNELPMMAPPSSLRDTVLAGAEDVSADVPLASSPPLARRTWVLGAVAAGATLLSLVLGVNNYRLRLANQGLQTELLAAGPAQQAQLILQQPATRFYDFAGTDQAKNAVGNMIVDTDGLEAAIAFKDLAPLSTDQTYALWVSYQGQYIPCGDFQPGQNGTVFATLEMPAVYQSRPWVKDVIVTVESTDLPPQPTGPIVAQTI
ncbi:anti-sigma factor domain-containing protein [Leptothoe kymatousa]|uniref:Regulator of SigK n=1 Tax=Leptothoe kymatousa TAU-MAC 1615 TaxID=2364775 RepID=A0ABS5Y3N9_9CYAN|nr:anti-sigma factor [Leptothoe kymatousa]MBT9312432.1 anti-sigma factor [Leptothoe kymatousa TAU-MAC 1615]